MMGISIFIIVLLIIYCLDFCRDKILFLIWNKWCIKFCFKATLFGPYADDLNAFLSSGEMIMLLLPSSWPKSRCFMVRLYFMCLTLNSITSTTKFLKGILEIFIERWEGRSARKEIISHLYIIILVFGTIQKPRWCESVIKYNTYYQQY